MCERCAAQVIEKSLPVDLMSKDTRPVRTSSEESRQLYSLGDYRKNIEETVASDANRKEVHALDDFQAVREEALHMKSAEA